MIHRSFNKAHQSNPQHKHNQLGWFWSTEESKPVFLADHAYGSNLPFASEYFMDEESKSGGFCIGPDSEATEASWEERKTFLKEMVLTDLRLEVTYLLSLSACAMGYLNLVNESVPTVKVHLNEGNVQMAEHLVTSMVGDPKILTNICPFLKDVDNGVPLVAPADERWLVDFTVIFSSDADWAPVRMKLPVPKAESKQKLNKFCKAAAGNYGMDVVRFAQALTEMPMEEVVRMFNSNRVIFESNDEIDFQAQKFGGVVLTALTIAEQMTGLTFHKEDVIAFLKEALAEPQDDTEED